MNKRRRELILTVPALLTTLSCSWVEAFACPGLDFIPSEYVPRKSLKNWVLGASDRYITKYYPNTPLILHHSPEFSIRTPVWPENNDLVRAKINLPNSLDPISINGVTYKPNTLECVGLDVIFESGKIEPTTAPDIEIFSNGTYQICSFNFPTAEITGIEFTYRRLEEGRMIAIARMVSAQEDRSTIALMSMTDGLRRYRCGGHVFVDS